MPSAGSSMKPLPSERESEITAHPSKRTLLGLAVNDSVAGADLRLGLSRSVSAGLVGPSAAICASACACTELVCSVWPRATGAGCKPTVQGLHLMDSDSVSEFHRRPSTSPAQLGFTCASPRVCFPRRRTEQRAGGCFRPRRAVSLWSDETERRVF